MAAIWILRLKVTKWIWKQQIFELQDYYLIWKIPTYVEKLRDKDQKTKESPYMELLRNNDQKGCVYK